MSFAVNNIYYIINAVFNLKVGLASDQDPNQLFQHIVGDRYDFGSSTRFVVTWTAEDTIRLSIDGAEIGENNGKVVACIDGAGDEWVTNLVSSTNGRYLYQYVIFFLARLRPGTHCATSGLPWLRVPILSGL